MRIGMPLTTAIVATALTVTVPMAAQAPAPQAKPSLVVLLVVDQFAARYVDTYGSHWTDGLKELITRGAYYTKAAYPYASTKTCAGHATIGTGTLPMTHGQIDNEWFDPKTRAFTTCTEDPASRALVYEGKTSNEHHGPRLLKVPTFADELIRQSGGRSRVVSVASKARSAIMMAGHGGPNATVVWSADTGGVWATSTAMARRTSPDVEAYVRAHPIDVKEVETWNRVAPDSTYQFADQAPGEPMATATFPHLFDQAVRTTRTTPDLIDSWESTPLPDAFVAGLAGYLVEKQQLGKRPGVTDMVAVSLSALDTIGHRYGPQSHEVQDVLLRLDKVIGDFLRTLDKQIGRDKYVLAFSADHGVGPLPEQFFPPPPGGRGGRGAGAGPGAAAPAAASAQTGDSATDTAATATTTAGRGAGANMQEGRTTLIAIANVVENLLDKEFGRGSWVEAAFGNNIYFRPGVLDRVRKSPALVKAIETALLAARGIAKVYWATDIVATTPTTDPILTAVRKSYVADRSGDLLFILKPNWVTSTDATHGSPYPYDTDVPVLFYGAGIKTGRYTSTASPADIVPTLSAITGVKMAKSDGQVLTEAIGK